ncbi:alpha/beta hydrolase [Micromonospora polyrhachis]|uniref:S-formylglutathione hydrolase FrmB n=1 Tax=Micromonospora polyrhachis TaxID=1282883 RepID=A0A7W7WSX6_9ACTN|nr:alpha/beta hydrolase-fold protein [Micromonospora polyrhachis]MBB4962615.1 S-formylglutathione hydrolase FrmB [Micromonospora polyrhachis]
MRIRIKWTAGRRLVAQAFVVLATTVATLGPPVSVSAADAPPALPLLPNPHSFGITVTGWSDVDPTVPLDKRRLVNLKLRTEAIYPGVSRPEIQVRILLPAHYDQTAARRYPVLYLLHGGLGKWDDWSNNGVKELVTGVAAFTGLVVMPEGGSTGYYTDWTGHADGGHSPQWETFHIRQLLPWVDANFRTDATRTGRSIAGLSMGGFGALKYAGRHPDLFSAVGSFSGATNMRYADGTHDAPATFSQHMQWSGAAIREVNFLDLATRVNLYENGWPVQDEQRQEDYRFQAVFGSPTNWPHVNPYDMAARYAAYQGRIALYSGGQQGGETDIYAYNNQFRAQLTARQVAFHWCVGDGTHSWEYWQRDLTDFLNLVYGTPIACHYTS